MKTPATRKGEDVPRNFPTGFDDALPRRLEIRGKENDQRLGCLMFAGAVDARGDAAVLRVRIIVAPGLIRPAEHVAIKLFRGRMSCLRCGGELDIIYPVLAWFSFHRIVRPA